jgi:hypothetical protein
MFEPIRLLPGLQERGFPALISNVDEAAEFFRRHIDHNDCRNHIWWQTAIAELNAYPSKQNATAVYDQLVNALRQEGWLEE